MLPMLHFLLPHIIAIMSYLSICFCFSLVFSLSYYLFYFFFFFSSRRRHTRCSRDWSSDVCSSDLDLLPIPAEPQEVEPFSSPGCQDFIVKGTRFFEIHEEERTVQVHSELGRKTSIWGYRDKNVSQSDLVLGPTFRVRMNEGGIVVRMKNDLPTSPAGSPDPLRGFGVPHMTTHLHGGHHPSRSDGFPDDIKSFFDNNNSTRRPQRFVSKPGQYYDYCYPLLDPGFSTGTPDDTERPSTLWYHDHFFDFTGPNVYPGLADFFLLFD